MLAKGGILFGETGDSEAVKLPSEWWYVHMVEHHIFWNRKSLEFFCQKYGFQLDKKISCAHKGRRYMSAGKRFIAWILHVSRNTFLADIAWYLRRLNADMIGNPYKRDHFIFALRKL